MKKKGKARKKAFLNKEEIAEDWCFECKDGGLLLVCDYKDCLKSYHAECAGKDESTYETWNPWACKWHSCFICQKSSKYQCFVCPNAMCQRCITAAEFATVRGNKGFCNNCLKLALLAEENVDFDSDGEKVDFKDRNTVEGLFKEYWDIIKEKEGFVLEHLHSADAQLKKGKKKKSGSCSDESENYDENQSASDDDDEDEIEEHKPGWKRERSKAMKKEMKSNKREFIGWGSKTLINFLESIGKDTSQKLSQYDVSSIISGYINENKLFHQEKKRKILCDDKLKSVLGRKTVIKHKIYDLLEPHFLENLEPSEDDKPEYSSEDKDENVFVACKKKRKSSENRKPLEKEVVFDAPKSCFASIVADNIKLVYLKRSTVLGLLKQPETFECKVIGSFVRVKLESSDYSLRNSHQLVQVTGIKKTSLEANKTETLLLVSNMSKDICISMLSDDNFSEKECEDLRQKVRGGLLRRPTIMEVQEKARSLHEDITKHWIVRELALLQNLIDRANEKGWRKELDECLWRRQRLKTPSEQLKLLEKVPEVIADDAEVELMFEEAVKEYKQEHANSPKSILMESSETPSDNGGGSGISSGDATATDGNAAFGNIGSGSANDGNGDAEADNLGSHIQGAKEKEHHACASIPEAKPSHASETLISEEEHQHAVNEKLPEQSHAT
ncbi:Zinc finger, PHD-type, conserved site protein [Actinidia chinensis var. chinensis]|uniref:Zinc finger, PHD-type, conserved site protein n=1 Tax=Actinidia chinensis var. chinensis TaxID=1590841 RepID=A0A2R6Q1N9_ACTCC|nr:Zinc finger, PHD-type, conserved site protein [Actinidia chinensis var. chinensis]